jgi:hypothetical protein
MMKRAPDNVRYLGQFGEDILTRSFTARDPKLPFTMTAANERYVKGFGCRPIVTYPRVLRAGVRKPPSGEPAEAGRTDHS